jgi:hypothetical protein
MTKFDELKEAASLEQFLNTLNYPSTSGGGGCRPVL